ncbi:hypothetical protein HDU92_003378 [Lobulomyces angularis]|nr:hypothetical protein HDU92_003378 [Lobulomyces angularis]
MSFLMESLKFTLKLDFGIQFGFYVVSALAKRTEIAYDLSGCLTFLACTLSSLLRKDSLHPRQLIASALVVTWSTRLGAMLFSRILKLGEDKRFDKFKKNSLTFAIPWFMQGVWIFLTALPVYIVLGNNSKQNPLSTLDFIGLAMWIFGFGVEVIADSQKNKFKTLHPDDFVNTGIWKYSRYANYNGEITLWFGLFLFCVNGFQDSWQLASVISPIFVAHLIINISGVKLLEKSANKKYGHREDYKFYTRTTSKFFLWPQKKLSSKKTE